MASQGHEKLELDIILIIKGSADNNSTAKTEKLKTNKTLLSKIPFFEAMLSKESNWRENSDNEIEISTPFDAFLAKQYIDIKVRNLTKQYIDLKVRKFTTRPANEDQPTSHETMLSFKKIADYFGDVETAVKVNETLVDYYHTGSGQLLELWALTDADGKSDIFLENFCRNEIKKFKQLNSIIGDLPCVNFDFFL